MLAAYERNPVILTFGITPPLLNVIRYFAVIAYSLGFWPPTRVNHVAFDNAQVAVDRL